MAAPVRVPAVSAAPAAPRAIAVVAGCRLACASCRPESSPGVAAARPGASTAEVPPATASWLPVRIKGPAFSSSSSSIGPAWDSRRAISGAVPPGPVIATGRWRASRPSLWRPRQAIASRRRTTGGQLRPDGAVPSAGPDGAATSVAPAAAIAEPGACRGAVVCPPPVPCPSAVGPLPRNAPGSDGTTASGVLSQRAGQAANTNSSAARTGGRLPGDRRRRRSQWLARRCDRGPLGDFVHGRS